MKHQGFLRGNDAILLLRQQYMLEEMPKTMSAASAVSPARHSSKGNDHEDSDRHPRRLGDRRGSRRRAFLD